MKNIIITCIIVIAFTNCKSDKKTEGNLEQIEAEEAKTPIQNDGLVLLKGEFVYYADAAVLQTNSSSIYGVVINEKMYELDKLAQQYKKEPTDYVSVEIRGEIIPKPENEEGWPYRINIKEILSVNKSQTEDEVIKLESQ
jgi:hypothetical protein